MVALNVNVPCQHYNFQLNILQHIWKRLHWYNSNCFKCIYVMIYGRDTWQFKDIYQSCIDNDETCFHKYINCHSSEGQLHFINSSIKAYIAVHGQWSKHGHQVYIRCHHIWTDLLWIWKAGSGRRYTIRESEHYESAQWVIHFKAKAVLSLSNFCKLIHKRSLI